MNNLKKKKLMKISAENHKNIVFEIQKIKTLYRCLFPGCSSKFKEKGNLITHNRIHVIKMLI